MDINTSYIRPKKAQFLQDVYSRPLTKKNKLTVKTLKNATVLPMKQTQKGLYIHHSGGVVDCNNVFCRESGTRNFTTDAGGKINAPFKNEEVIFLGNFSTMWGHFLLDTLPRFGYVLSSKYSGQKIIITCNYLQNKQIYGNFLEVFKLLGINNKIEIINKPYKYKKITVPEISFLCDKYYTDEFIELINYIRHKALKNQKTETSNSNNLFLSRLKGHNNTYEFGQDMLENFFQNNNYKIIYPEKLSLSTLIQYFDSSEKITTISGTAAHNFLFAPDNANCTIIERIACPSEYQESINKIKKINITYIDANFHLYPVHPHNGPTIIYFNKGLQKYAIQNNLEWPNNKYLTMKYKKTLYNNYIITYKNLFHLRGRGSKGQIQHIELIHEAYQETIEKGKDIIKDKHSRDLFA